MNAVLRGYLGGERGRIDARLTRRQLISMRGNVNSRVLDLFGMVGGRRHSLILPLSK